MAMSVVGLQPHQHLGCRHPAPFLSAAGVRSLVHGRTRCKAAAPAAVSPCWPHPQQACLHQQQGHGADQPLQQVLVQQQYAGIQLTSQQRLMQLGQTYRRCPAHLLQRPGLSHVCRAASDSSSTGATGPSSSGGGSSSLGSSNTGSDDAEQASSSSRHGSTTTSSSPPQQVPPPPAPRPQPTNNSSGWNPLTWFNKGNSRGKKNNNKAQQPLRLVFNLLMLFFLMRLWPLGGRLGLGESETLVMSVPFSEFVRRVRHDDVSTVSVDGLHVSFSLKPGSIALPGGWGAD